MKVLSLMQPWASLVMLGEKAIETRSWSTSYRGELAIHVSKKYLKEDLALSFTEPFFSSLRPNGKFSFPESYLGKIICVVDLSDCLFVETVKDKIGPKELAFGNYGPKRFAWILKNPWPLEQPIPAKGSLGLWDYEVAA